MARKHVPKSEHVYTAVETDEWIDPGTGEVKRRLKLFEPETEEPGPLRGRPRKGTTRNRITRKRSKRVGNGYAMLDTESMGMLDLTRQEWRVFSFLLSKVETGTGEIRVTNSYISKSIEMTPNNVSRTMKSLRERHIILAEAYGVWRINSNIAWVGDWKKWNAAANDDPEPIWDSTEPAAHLEIVP